MNNLGDNPPLVVREFGLSRYEVIWQLMKDFTEHRTALTPDECWIGEHPPIFTQGQAGKPEHLLRTRDIPVVQTDRGGQVTYHGPGQLVLYALIDLNRNRLTLKDLTNALEKSVIALLRDFSILGATIPHAPGIYIQQAKIASLGLKIKRGCSYHGLSLNVNMDLEPFSRINPCGHRDLKMTQMANFKHASDQSVETVAQPLAAHFAAHLSRAFVILPYAVGA